MVKKIFLLLLVLSILPISFATLNDAVVAITFDDAQIFNTDDQYDVSGYNNDGTMQGTGTTGVTGIINEAYDFDGSTHYMTIPNDASFNLVGSQKHIVAWVYSDVSLASGQWQIVAHYDGTKQDYVLQVFNGNLWFNSRGGSSSTQAITGTAWHMVEGYVDGSGNVVACVDLTCGTATTEGSNSQPTSSLEIGSRVGGSLKWNGKIDYVLIYDRKLSTAERTELYNSGSGYDPYDNTVANITIQSNNYNSTINVTQFNATVTYNGTTDDFTTSNGEIITNFTTSSEYLANITIESVYNGYYINQSVINHNFSSGEPYVFNYSLINFSVYDDITTAAVSSFNISTNYTDIETFVNDYTGYTLLSAGSYFINVSSEGYVDNNATYTVAESYYTYDINLNPADSLHVWIYNASSGSLITGSTVNIVIEGTNYSASNSTTSGKILYSGLAAGTYNLTFTGTGLETTQYQATVTTGAYTRLNAFIESSTGNNVVFTFKDYDTGRVLEDVSFTVERKINASYTTVGTFTSDISGRVQVSYIEDTEYRYTASLTDYATKIFTLNPVIFTSYTVRLEANNTAEDSQAFAGISVSFTPSTYYNDQTNNLSVTFSSPSGSFLYYNYNVTASNNVTIRSGSGTNAYGEVLTNSYTIANARINDTVTLRYGYIKAGEPKVDFVKVYSIADTSGTIFSFLDNADNPYGIPLIDRVIISVITAIFAAGVAFWFGGLVVSAVFGIFVLGYLSAIGFLPIWAGIVTMLFVFMMVAWRSSL